MLSPRYRKSEFLNKRQASACLQGAGLSEELGYPLNMQVTVDLRHTAVSVDAASHAFEKMRSGHFVRWFARKKLGIPAFYVWTIETAGGGAHINWLVHLPEPVQAEFRRKLERWFAGITGQKDVPPTALHIQPIGTTAKYGTGLMPLVRYICKGINPTASRMFIQPVPQGTVTGKRSGVSRALGKSAIRRRRAAGFAKPVKQRPLPRTPFEGISRAKLSIGRSQLNAQSRSPIA